MRTWQIAGLLTTTSLFFFACSDAGDNGTKSSKSALNTAECAPIDPARSLFVTGATELDKFPLQAVMEQIVRTGTISGGPTALDLYQQMVDTLNDKANAQTNGPHCDDVIVNGKATINGFPIECPRQEGVLAKTNPFGTDADSYTALGVVNRFDLAPQNGSNCGQHRVVYGKNSGKSSFNDRMLLIFEATLPNPNPSAGLGGCKPVAQFWADLSNDNDAGSRAEKLATFYFQGLPGFQPVIHANHYGIGGGTDTGQIRANMFMNRVSQQQWQLREFRLGRVCGETLPCRLTAFNTSVGVNPFGGLFGPDGLSTDFQSAFLNQVEPLASKNLNTIGMSVIPKHNAGESNQSDTSNDYIVQAQSNPGLHQNITKKLEEIGRTDLTSANIIERATTQSCAGCHQLSPGRDIGDGFTWPLSNLTAPPNLRFTHINENRVLSPALNETFLPFRAQVLNGFLNGPVCSNAEPPPGNSSENRTIGGGLVGAAN